jgi:catalase
MNQSGNLPRSEFGSLVLIAAVLGGGAAALATRRAAFAWAARRLGTGEIMPRESASPAPGWTAPLNFCGGWRQMSSILSRLGAP